MNWIMSLLTTPPAWNLMTYLGPEMTLLGFAVPIVTAIGVSEWSTNPAESTSATRLPRLFSLGSSGPTSLESFGPGCWLRDDVPVGSGPT